ncbi:protein of unknown function DUF421 [Alkaliphilus metalliredigens QYMF]|uniref:YetF C-terminal domain-containing protein n=1 Tax=Alkaliphilus metalliredigens (strain QYMF) TaxID=293826 RepID=A6TVT8_ALKMQ|nr:DUF421 domain-containing protein [Alkaliphilus metalliredigens]ABR50306.1 protein of unknown function DUF421 [Alkaliphilus metalliredigens QYMF]
MEEWIEIVLRSVGLFLFTFVLIRLMGKRQIVRMTPFHFIGYGVIMIVAALASTKVIPNIVMGIVAMIIWGGLIIAIEYVSLKSKSLHHWVYGKETVLIKNGKIMEENLKQLRVTGEELLSSLRSKDAFNVADVEFAVMESSGEVNMILKSDKVPITPFHLEQQVAPQKPPQTVILDGNILDEPLSNLGLNRGWLMEQLEKDGISVDNIFVGQVNGSGELYMDLFDDSIQMKPPQVKQMLYAGLEKSQADLSKFSLDTKEEEAKRVYQKNATDLEEMMKKIRPYLLR